MLRARSVLAGGGIHANAGSVCLDYEGRYRRRIIMETDLGETILLDLARACLLADGDGLKLDDGRIVAVRAQPEHLMRVEGHNPQHLLRLAWHIGNRHLAAMIEGDHVLIRADHVIAEMLRGLGARVTHVTAPFAPESGAYDPGSQTSETGSSHGHAHAHSGDHAHHHHHGHVHDHD
jgi:urease accessory protein